MSAKTITNEQRLCPKCNTNKDIEQFYSYTNDACKKCLCQYKVMVNRIMYEKNREKLAQRIPYRLINPERWREYIKEYMSNYKSELTIARTTIYKRINYNIANGKISKPTHCEKCLEEKYLKAYIEKDIALSYVRDSPLVGILSHVQWMCQKCICQTREYK